MILCPLIGPSCDFVVSHQGQCPHQVSLNLANHHFQGLTRFLSQGLLSFRTVR